MSKAHLTPALIRSLRADDKKVEVFEEMLTGLLVEVRPSGRKTFAIRYTDRFGKQRQYKLGSADILTLAHARRMGKDVLANVLTGSNPQETRKALRAMPTVTEFVWTRYMPFVETYKAMPAADEGAFRRYILPLLGSRPMSEVTSSDVLALMANMRKRGLGPASIQRTLQVLRYAYNVAIKQWRIPGLTINPADGIPEPSTPKRNRYLTEEELGRLLAVLRSDHDQRAAQAALLLLLTGARRMEVLKARWEWVDLQAGTLLVPKSKNGKPRYIVLNDRAIELIRALPRKDHNPFLFPHPRTGQPYHITKSWERMRKKAGLPDLRLHDLRHSFASFLINQGASLYVVKDLLGHSSVSTTERYSHLTRGTKTQAAQLIADMPLMRGAGAGKPSRPRADGGAAAGEPGFTPKSPAQIPTENDPS